MSEKGKNALAILLLVVIFFVVYNMYVDFKDMFNTKDLGDGILNKIFKNNIII